MEINDPQSQPQSQPQPAPAAAPNAAPQPTQEIKPDSFLAWAIVSTLLCCLPAGIVAIVYASQVDSYWFANNHEASRRAARLARTWTWVSVGIAAFCWLVYLLLVFVFATALSLPFYDL